ncbi:MAG: lycopene cyclase family protein, partial [Bacteroidota bacterium]
MASFLLYFLVFSHIFMQKYDYIIAGAGCAGLSLAYHLVRSEHLQDKRILLLDIAKKVDDDRTWCYWSADQAYFSEIPQHSWTNITFASHRIQKSQSIQPLSYHCLRGIDFYEHIYKILDDHPQVEQRWERILQLKNTDEGASVKTEQGLYQAEYVFSSIADASFKSQKENYYHTRQHFKGYFIKTQEYAFDTDEVTLMDFRAQSEEQPRFFYVLPFSPREALVEFTVFSDGFLENREYEKELDIYIKEKLGISSFHILAEENGVIPMTDFPFKRRSGKSIIHLGTQGGLTKATTGYTFQNIQKACQEIVRKLDQGERPYYHLQSKARFGFYDRLLLHIIKYRKERVAPIMQQLFMANDFKKVLKFLDE